MPDDIQGAFEKSASDTIAVLLDKLAAGAWNQKENILSKARLKFNAGFQQYLHQTFERCSKTKTIINRSEPVLVRDIHVPLHFRIGEKIYLERVLLDKLLDGQQIVITGIAGCGKSMSMRSIYLHLAQTGRVIPVFAELRHAAEFDGSLLAYLTAQIGSFVAGFTEDGLKYGLREGIVVLVLDGFDEIAKDKHDRLEREILEIANEAPMAKMLISGRPSERYSSWHTFYEAMAQELDQSQVETLISRMQYDVASIDRLIKRVKTGLYETHTSLLGNPLLCSMMLLTFDEFSDIPSKMFIFYRKAFEVLYRKHDTLKPQYTREFHTELSEDDFVRLFEAFCFLSFADEFYSFEGDFVYNYVDEAIAYDGIGNVTPKNYVSDLVENVCVILKEGEHFNFLHRSFQEYFAACFVIGRGRSDISDAIEGLGSNLFDTSVVEFMAEMNREALDRTYGKKIIPKILNDLHSNPSPSFAFNLFYSQFAIKNDGTIMMHTYVGADLPKYAVHFNIIEKVYQRSHGYDGPYIILQKAALELGILNPSNKGEIVFGPEANNESFEEILKKSGYRDVIIQYLTAVLADLMEVEARRDALMSKRALSRRVFKRD